MKELKPCPFCGGEPLLEPYEVRKAMKHQSNVIDAWEE